MHQLPIGWNMPGATLRRLVERTLHRIDGLALAGRGDEARSAVLAVTRAARAAGRDLAPHLALRISLVLERERAVASAG